MFHRLTRPLYALVLCALLSACQSTGLWLANVPSHVNPALETHSNRQYGAKYHQRLDIYTPRGTADTKQFYPVIMFLHGGAWETGYKEQYRFVADSLVKHGFVVVIPDYAKYPAASYPDFEWDAAAASRWISDNIADYKGDVNALHLMGHSAGAHMGAMLLVGERFLRKHQLDASMYRSFVGIAGPYDFTPTEPKYKKIFGNGPDYSHMQAPHYVNGNEPPMLLMHGEEDTVVSSENMRALAAAMDANDGTVQSKLYLGLDHLGIIGAFSRSFSPLTGDSPVRDAMHWFKRYSR